MVINFGAHKYLGTANSVYIQQDGAIKHTFPGPDYLDFEDGGSLTMTSTF